MESRFEDKLKQTYSYDPESGLIFIGDKKVGWENRNGYTYVTTPFGKKVLAHRLAWLLHHGDWPKGDVDHINRSRSDNRISNLRELSRSQNLLNMDTPLLKGIYWDKQRGKWYSRTGRDGPMKRFDGFCGAYNYRKKQYIEYNSSKLESDRLVKERKTKVCGMCKETKSRSEFHKCNTFKDGLQYQCKVCRRQYKKQWYEKNPEKVSEYEKRRRQKHYKKISKYMKQWRQENFEKVLTYNAKRRALKREAVPDALANCPEEKDRVNKIYELRDLFTKTTGIEHHVDHIWPLSKGGPHWSGNLQIITAEENLSKRDTFCEETARVIQESLDEYISARQ